VSFPAFCIFLEVPMNRKGFLASLLGALVVPVAAKVVEAKQVDAPKAEVPMPTAPMPIRQFVTGGPVTLCAVLWSTFPAYSEPQPRFYHARDRNRKVV
jgi:hypothetical protein